MGFLGGGNHIFIVNKDFLHIAPGLEEWTEVHAGSTLYTKAQQTWEIAVSTASDLYIYNKGGELCAGCSYAYYGVRILPRNPLCLIQIPQILVPLKYS